MLQVGKAGSKTVIALVALIIPRVERGENDGSKVLCRKVYFAGGVSAIDRKGIQHGGPGIGFSIVIPCEDVGRLTSVMKGNGDGSIDGGIAGGIDKM